MFPGIFVSYGRNKPRSFDYQAYCEIPIRERKEVLLYGKV